MNYIGQERMLCGQLVYYKEKRGGRTEHLRCRAYFFFLTVKKKRGGERKEGRKVTELDPPSFPFFPDFPSSALFS
jgi:hypothetical protein